MDGKPPAVICKEPMVICLRDNSMLLWPLIFLLLFIVTRFHAYLK